MELHGLMKVLNRVAMEYPCNMVEGQLRDVPRIAFNISLAVEAARPHPPSELAICDLGGGIGLFSVGCAAAGFRRVVLVDDFKDPVNQQTGDSIFTLHRKYKVEVISRDVVLRGIADVAKDLDVVATFDSMEHWHHSPQKLFKEVVAALVPGGVFLLGVPNCVNLRKRITVPLGHGKWSSMAHWYETEVFRGHVREPDVGDLKYIARDMGLCEICIVGRNWLGYYSSNAAIRLATRVFDLPLRLVPSLCSDIYLVGKTSRFTPRNRE